MALKHDATTPRDRALTLALASGMVVGAGATGVQISTLSYVRGWGVLTTDTDNAVVALELTGPDGFEFRSTESDDFIVVVPAREELEEQALQVAFSAPAANSDEPALPDLTGNLVRDARQVLGLTAQEFGQLFGRTERAGQLWRSQGVPADARSEVQALLAIGLTLVGGLGPAGAKRWLLSGSPSPWDRIRAGEISSVAAEVRELEDSVAT
jgi:hypothetical protein